MSAMTRPTLDDWFRTRIYGGMPQIVRHAISPSTWRAFGETNEWTPSSLFGTWACRESWDISKTLETFTSADDYEAWHAKTVESLRGYWYRHDGSKIDFPKAAKLIDLLMKHILLASFITKKARENLKLFAHVPLDKYSLGEIRNIADDQIKKLLPIGKNIAMGDVKSRWSYAKLQRFIREQSEPPIHFDVRAWNNAHSDFELTKNVKK